MAVSTTIQYSDNLGAHERQILAAFESGLLTTLGQRFIDGGFRWTAKMDSQCRILYVLEQVSIGQTIGYYTEKELAFRSPENISSDIVSGSRKSYPETLIERQVFSNLLPEDRAAIVNERRTSCLLVDYAVIGMSPLATLPTSASMPTHVETPPLPLTGKEADKIFVHSPAGLPGAWQRLYIMTYRFGGHIYFKEIGESQVEAVIKFD